MDELDRLLNESKPGSVVLLPPGIAPQDVNFGMNPNLIGKSVLGGEAQANADTRQPVYSLSIMPGISGGYAVWFEREMFIANTTEDLPGVILAAIGRLKIKG